jgi:YVTN family beta-propeller protein
MAQVELPRGTVTLLFTDIEGSTRLLKQLRDGYGEVLADHRRLLRAAFEAHGGREIDTQGDAFFVAFPRAKDAVAAAVDAQTALASHEWPDGAVVRVRMGIHTGEPVVGDDGYHGLGLHRGARICSAGHGGQILLSGVTTGLVEDEDVEVVDLGAHRLKDMDRPERLSQVVYPGMPPTFPPLKTAEETPFEGQEDALAEKVASRFGWARPRRSRALAVVAVAVVVLAAAAFLLTRGDDGTTLAELTEDSLGILSPDGAEAASVAVGTSPSAVAVGEGSIWVANADGETVSRIDPDDRRVTQTIPVGHSPQGVAVAGGFVWVSNGLDGTVSQIDPRIGGGKVVHEVRVGNQPTAMAADGDVVWVANSTDGTVSRIDAGTGKAGGPFKIGGGADAVAVGEGAVWVVSERTATVTSLDPKSGEALEQIPVGQGPTAVAVGAGSVWVANTLEGTVSKIDPARGVVAASVPVGREPRGLAAGKTAVWVSDESGRVARIDPAKADVTKIVRVGNRPSAIAVDGDGLYVALRAAGPAHRGGVLRLASEGLLDSVDPGLAYSCLLLLVLDAVEQHPRRAGRVPPRRRVVRQPARAQPGDGNPAADRRRTDLHLPAAARDPLLGRAAGAGR